MDVLLTARQMQILDAIVQDYIRTGEPVGSRTLSKRYVTALSPATIRNEMAELEERGLLRQPHTSAGRIPSDSGYRFFVEQLMARPRLAREQRRAVTEALGPTPRDYQSTLTQAVRVLAALSQCAAIVAAPHRQAETVKRLQLVQVSSQAVLAVVVTTNGDVHQYPIQLPEAMADGDLARLTNCLNAHAAGLSLQEAVSLFSQTSGPVPAELRGLLGEIAAQLAPQLEQGARIYTWGTSHVLREPEFTETARMVDLVHWLEQEQEVYTLLGELAPHSQAVWVTIGRENPAEPLHVCSVVTARYRAGDVSGTLAVLGPTRMDYAQAYAAVEVVAEHLSSVLDRLMH